MCFGAVIRCVADLPLMLEVPPPRFCSCSLSGREKESDLAEPHNKSDPRLLQVGGAAWPQRTLSVLGQNHRES